MKLFKPGTKLLYTGKLNPGCNWYHQRIFIVVGPYVNIKNDGSRSHSFRVPGESISIEPTDQFVLENFIEWKKLSLLEKALWS